MSQKENELLSSAEVDELATLVEEATRAAVDVPKAAEGMAKAAAVALLAASLLGLQRVEGE